MRNHITACAALLTLALMLSACPSGGGSSGGIGFSGGQPTQLQYQIDIVQPAADGAQVGRAFSITLNFVEPGTATPRQVFGSEQLSASVASGPGTLSGTTTMAGNGSATLTFNNLILNTAGAYTLTFNGPNASGPAVTTSFNVGAQRDLQFSTLPTDALRNRAFSVTVRTVDPATGNPATQTYPVQITVALASGAGNLSGTLVQTLNAGASSLVFNNLLYDQVGQITLSASAFGFTTIVSTPFNVEGVVMTWTGVPSSILVNGVFSLTVSLTGQLSGGPISPNISATLTLASGTGQLTGSTTANSSGSTITFSGLTYNQIGAATFTASSAHAASVTTGVINFGVGLTVTATGGTSRSPGQSWAPFTFRAVDGTGATWTGTISNLSWQITNAASAVIQSSTASFTAGVASVTPAPIATVGSYTLTGSITSPNAASANIGLSVTNLTFINEPGPFVALKSVRVNNPYTDTVSGSAPGTTISYALLSGSLPPGLTLNAGNGTISGTPTTAGSYAFSLYAELPGAQAQPIRCALAVFTATESEIVSGQSFVAAGPYQVAAPIIDTFTFTSSFDGITWALSGTPACRMQIYYPNFGGSPAPPSPAPVLVHHRGRGFNYEDYDNLGAHLASYGFIFVSVEDYQSFFVGSSGGGYTPYGAYDNNDIARCHTSASGFQEGAMERLLVLNSTSASPLFNRVDRDNIFMSGHSRGGGATHYSHLRNVNLKIKGVIYFMAYDLRIFTHFVSGSGTAPSYLAMPTPQPRLPSLIIASENDGDLTYPICDQLLDRATGPATFATVYGGNHNYLGDTNNNEQWGTPYISRAQQQQRIFNLVVGFLKRWTNLDLSLEGFLYTNEFAGSNQVGVTAWRNMAERVLVDDHQNGSSTSNTLGGTNSISTGGTMSVASSIFPNTGNMASLQLRHLVTTLQPNSNVTYTVNIPAASQDMSRTRRFMFRTGSIDVNGQTLKGFDWVTVRVRLVDLQNDQATVTLFDRTAPSTTYLPDYPGSGSNVYDRFVDASVMLSTFTSANPQLNLNQLQRIELVFETAAGVSRQLYFDNLRFE